ncbi:hypothetical protein ACC709_25285 [Rhizobium ruizarguesonis]
MQEALAAAWQKLVLFRLRQGEIVRNPFRDIGHAGLALGGEAQDGKHEGLVVGIMITSILTQDYGHSIH